MSLKTYLLIFIFTCSVVSAQNQTANSTNITTQCQLSLFAKKDMASWNMFGRGLIAGLNVTAPSSKAACRECTGFGYQLGLFQTALYNIEYARLQWIDSSKVLDKNFLDLLEALLNVYPQFKALTKTGLKVLQDRNVNYSIDQVISFVNSQEKQTKLIQNMMQKHFLIYHMVQSIPGSDCYTTGYKISKPIQLLFDVIPTLN